MVRTILKVIAYTQAPRTTYTVLHPKNAVRLKKMSWDMRHSLAPRVAAAGAAAVAFPLGIAVSRLAGRVRSRLQQADLNGPRGTGAGGPRVRPLDDRATDPLRDEQASHGV